MLTTRWLSVNSVGHRVELKSLRHHWLQPHMGRVAVHPHRVNLELNGGGTSLTGNPTDFLHELFLSDCLRMTEYQSVAL